MTRKARHDGKGYYYHVYARGQRKNPIFFSNDDIGAFINILKQVLDETDIELYAYCIMRNHFHLLVYRRNTPLAQFMRKVNTKYALYFNNKYGTVGHVFQGRFGSEPLLEEERDLPIVINYIHYNPVDAGIVSKESDYPFSSAGFYEGKKSYIEQLKRIDYDRSITDREFETYKGVIGTKEEYNKLLKRKPGREKRHPEY
ncbi:MAG: transposase [bacterium]